MKKILFLLTILVSVPAFSQSADERIGTFLNQADWFGLEKNYPILKDSMQADFLKLMSEALIGYYFNRPDEALQSIHKLLVNHQAEIGGQNALNMAILAGQLRVSKGIMPQPHKTREALWNNSNSKMQNKECTKALKVSVISMIS